ncbi:MAG: hypothetical protein ACREOO_14270 [bacterium]
MPDEMTVLEEHVRLRKEHWQPREKVWALGRSNMASSQAGREKPRLTCKIAQAKSAELLFFPAPTALSSVPAGPVWPFPSESRKTRRDHETIIAGNRCSDKIMAAASAGAKHKLLDAHGN